jgi:hypothetical protein
MMKKKTPWEIRNVTLVPEQAPSGAYDHIFSTVRHLQVGWCGGTLSDKKIGLSVSIAAGPRQRSYFWVRVPSFFIASYDSQGCSGGIRPDCVLLCTASYIVFGNHGECLLHFCWHGNLCWNFIYTEMCFILSCFPGIYFVFVTAETHVKLE